MHARKWVSWFILSNTPIHSTGMSGKSLNTHPLACSIRKNKNIIGFPLPKPGNNERVEAKLNAYVDDSQFFNSTENFN